MINILQKKKKKKVFWNIVTSSIKLTNNKHVSLHALYTTAIAVKLPRAKIGEATRKALLFPVKFLMPQSLILSELFLRCERLILIRIQRKP